MLFRSPTYKGWQTGGLSLSLGQNTFSLERRLGSRNQLNELLQHLAKKDINLLLHQDFVLANPRRPYDTSRDIVKKINRTIARKPTNRLLYPSLLLFTPEKSLENAEIFIDRLNSDNILNNIGGFQITTLANTIFSFYTSGTIYRRSHTKNIYKELIQNMSRYPLALQLPNDYMWNYTHYFLDMPLYTSKYSFITHEIPFIPMVLKGTIPFFARYVNFASNQNEFLLKMIEYGALPSFLLTAEEAYKLRDTNSSHIFSSKYTSFLSRIVEYYRILKEIHEKTYDSLIVNHRIISDGFVVVSYENGVRIIINYSDSQMTYDKNVVQPNSFLVLEGN